MNVRVQTWDGEAWADLSTWRVMGSRRQVVYLAADDGRLLTFQRINGRSRHGGDMRIHPDDMAAIGTLPTRAVKPRTRDASAYPEGGRVTRGRGRPREDFTGRVVVLLTVLGPVPDRNGRPHWRCRCVCKRVVIVSSDNLRAALRVDDDGQPIPGGVRSCGCLQDEARARVLRARAA